MQIKKQIYLQWLIWDIKYGTRIKVLYRQSIGLLLVMVSAFLDPSNFEKWLKLHDGLYGYGVWEDKDLTGNKFAIFIIGKLGKLAESHDELLEAFRRTPDGNKKTVFEKIVKRAEITNNYDDWYLVCFCAIDFHQGIPKTAVIKALEAASSFWEVESLIGYTGGDKSLYLRVWEKELELANSFAELEHVFVDAFWDEHLQNLVLSKIEVTITPDELALIREYPICYDEKIVQRLVPA